MSWIGCKVDPLSDASISRIRSRSERDPVALHRPAHRDGIIRLVGALMLETNDELAAARQYMSLETLARVTDNRTVATDDAALTGASLAEIPLVVIAAGDSMAGIPGWAEAQAELAALSREGRLVVAEGSSHLVQIDQPEIVIDAVLSVLDAARPGE